MYEVFVNVFNIIIIIKFIIHKLPEHECCLINHDDEYVGLLVFILLIHCMMHLM